MFKSGCFPLLVAILGILFMGVAAALSWTPVDTSAAVVSLQGDRITTDIEIPPPDPPLPGPPIPPPDPPTPPPPCCPTG